MKIGTVHSAETKARMSASAKRRKRTPRTAEWNAKIAAGNRGKKMPKRYIRACQCGAIFASGASNAKFCSRQCARAHRGRGIRHLPEFRRYARVCAICGTTEQLVGDHDHKTGRPRGILCRKCNLALGNMDDNPARLRAAALYLERN